MEEIKLAGQRREAFVIAQVSAERLIFKTLNLSGKSKLRMPNTEDMTRRYMKLYDGVKVLIEEIDSEDLDA